MRMHSEAPSGQHDPSRGTHAVSTAVEAGARSAGPVPGRYRFSLDSDCLIKEKPPWWANTLLRENGLAALAAQTLVMRSLKTAAYPVPLGKRPAGKTLNESEEALFSLPLSTVGGEAQGLS